MQSVGLLSSLKEFSVVSSCWAVLNSDKIGLWSVDIIKMISLPFW